MLIKILFFLLIWLFAMTEITDTYCNGTCQRKKINKTVGEDLFIHVPLINIILKVMMKYVCKFLNFQSIDKQ